MTNSNMCGGGPVQFPPGEALVLRRKDGGEEHTAAMEELLAGSALTPGDIVLPRGVWPVCVEGLCIIAASMDTAAGTIVHASAAGAGELRELLDASAGPDPVLLIDPGGRILAASAAAAAQLGEAAGLPLDSVLCSGSAPLFHAALADCRSGVEQAPFNVEIRGRGGPVTAVVSLRLLPVPGGLVTARFAPPSLSLAGFSPVESSFIETVFRSLPVPALLVDREGRISRANDSAVRTVAQMGSRNPTGTLFLDWVAPPDRESLESFHRKRSGGGYAPSTYETRLQSDRGFTVAVEVTALKLPEGTETLVFVIPSESMAGRAPERSGLIGGMLTALGGAEGTEPRRMVLEFIMAGTGARGVALWAGGTTTTVGEVPAGTRDLAIPDSSKDDAGEVWSRTEDGLFDVTIGSRLRTGPSRLSLFGIQQAAPDSLTRLVLGLAPLLADYAEALTSLQRVMQTFTHLVETWEILQDESPGLDRFLDRVAASTGSSQVCVWSGLDGEGGLAPLATTGTTRMPDPLGVRSETSAGWAYAHNESVYVADTLRDSRFSPVTPESRSELSVPLMRKGRAQGVMTAVSPSPGAFANPVPMLLRLYAAALSLWLYPESHQQRQERSADEGGTPASTEAEDILLGVAHRMRAPAAAVSGISELLLSGGLGPLPPESLEAVRSLARAAESLSRQSDRLLSLVRLELTQQRHEPAWGRPGEVLEAMLPSLRARASSAGLAFEAVMEGEPFTAMFDRAWLEEIIYNLMDNAVRFNRPNGSITLRLRPEGNSWILEVEDTGAGIPSRSLPFVFDRFFRSREDGSSLGIGLTIVKRLVERLGGTISVFSREGRGTRFSLRFPVGG